MKCKKCSIEDGKHHINCEELSEVWKKHDEIVIDNLRMINEMVENLK